MPLALVVVPPLLKVTSGPLLGPAMLIGAARRAGHEVEGVDLNAAWLRDRLPPAAGATRPPCGGGHDRPSDDLRRVQREWAELCGEPLPVVGDVGLDESRALTLTYDHPDVLSAARALAS